MLTLSFDAIKVFTIACICLYSQSTFGQTSSRSHVLSAGQVKDYERLKWNEIRSDSILYNYSLPIIINPTKDDGLAAFRAWHKLKRLPIAFKFDLISNYSNVSKNLRERVMGTVLIDLNRKVYFQYDFEVDSDGVNDKNFRGYQTEAFGRTTGYLQQELVVFQYDNGHVIGGRGNYATSVFNQSLLINSNNPPEEYLWWHQQNGTMMFDWSLIFLDPVLGYQRFLSTHRYGIKKNKISIGFSELVIAMYNELGAREFRYISPSSFFYETEVNGSKNSNLFWNFDLLYKFGSFSVVSELLIDDYAIDGKTPPKLAVKIGLGKNGNIVDWYSEYVRINRWTGAQYDPPLRFSDSEVLLGHPIGPDSHSLKYELFFNPKNWIDISYSFYWIESGSGTIDEWPDGIGPSENYGFSTEPFPSRPISTIYQSSTLVSLLRADKFNFDFEVTHSTASAPIYDVSVQISL